MIGQTISHYRILEKLGEGGMGIVYKAEDTKLHRPVALKLLSLGPVSAPANATQRLAQEAQAAASLNHPNIATIFEFSEFDDPDTHVTHAFIAMEYVEGTTLRIILKQGPLPIPKVVSIMAQLANALQTAHAKNIVHRDLKPENIVLTPDGTAKILDFGISKILGSSTTATGPITGSTAYMSPEQARGDPVDQRSDLFSLGVVLYELVTGRRPFAGDHEAAVLYSILNVDPVPPSKLRTGLSEQIERMILRLLQKNPDERYQNAGDFGIDVQSLLFPDSIVAPVRPWTLKRRLLSYGLAVLVGLSILLFYSPLEFSDRTEAREIPDIVVLPFVNIDRNSADQVFCDGLLEILTSKLSELQKFQRSISVIPSVDVRRRNISSVAEARTAFNASLVVSGSFQRIDDVVRLTLTLNDAKQLRQIQSKVLQDTLRNAAAFQDGIVLSLASMLDLQLKPETVRYLASDSTTSPRAYVLYLQAKGLLSQRIRTGDVDTVRLLFQKALGEDPSYIDAYAGVASTYEIQRNYSKAESTYQLALRQRPREWRAFNNLGLFYYKQGRFEKAASAFQQVIALSPENVRGYNNLGGVFLIMKRKTEALSLFERSLAVAPNYQAYNNLGAYYFFMGQFDTAASMQERALAIYDRDYRTWGSLGSAFYWDPGQRRKAAAAYKTAIALAEKNAADQPNNAKLLSHLADFHSMLGENEKALTLIRESLTLPPPDAEIMERAGEVYEQLGMREKALEWIEKALSNGYREIIEQSPGLAELRKDKRYQAFNKQQ